MAAFQYNGRAFDPGTGFHDYGARMYWPQIGRFVSPDPAEPNLKNPASFNRYSYVYNNPYKYTDPDEAYRAPRRRDPQLPEPNRQALEWRFVMKVTTRELREAALRLLAHLDEMNQSTFEIDEDYYWAIPPDSRYNPSSVPNNLTVGQLTDDWQEVQGVAEGRREPIGYGLVWLASLLQRVGEKAVG